MDPDNVERYDRQIRLWGQHGQMKCSNSKVCLINANTLGVEVLKGLCLAGICSFTILDSGKLTVEDVGCSFLQYSAIGENRGDSVKSMLLDLNEDVIGHAYPLEAHLPHLTQSEQGCDTNDESAQDIQFWKQFNCIVISGFLYTDQITRLSKICWTLNIPLILCKSIGFFGSMRTQVREHLIIETHSDNVLPDLNLDAPFKDLEEYFQSIDLDDPADCDDVSKYPYVVVVYKFLQKWQLKNNYPSDRLPGSYLEKKELRAMIDEGLKVKVKQRKEERSKNANSGTGDDEMPFENYIEASKAVNTCLTSSSKLPASIEAIFNHPKMYDSNPRNVSRFWLIIKALREFVQLKNGGRLPVSGSIPDMISSSEEYIRLLRIYAKKAKEDIDNILVIVQNLVRLSYCSSGGSYYDEIRIICKNIRDLRILDTTPIFEDYDYESSKAVDDDEEDEFITVGLSLKALDMFFSLYGRLPGNQDDQVEIDISKLKDCVKQIVGKSFSQFKTLDQCLYEICRYGGAELHATSAFLGGCVAQEVIKLITNQYIPVEDTLIYNAAIGSIKTFRFSDSLPKVS